MSTNDRTLHGTITDVIGLLEGHDDAEYEALPARDKANYQEVLEFLFRLESSIETEDATDSEPITDGGESTEAEAIDCELSATLGRDEALAGPFGPDDVVIYDPDEPVVDERWISMAHDATVSLETMR